MNWLSHQLMVQKTVQELIPRRESKLQRNNLSITYPASQLQGDLSYPSSFNNKLSNLSQAVRYLVDLFLALSFTLNP